MPEMAGRGLAVEIRADQKLKDLKLAFLTVASFGEVGRELKMKQMEEELERLRAKLG